MKFAPNLCVRVTACHKPLAACVIAAHALAGQVAFANVLVANCNDTGEGSLRAAVASAANGDVVDMTQLTTASDDCAASKITLRSGDIVASQSSLTISGPTSALFTVTSLYSPSALPVSHRILTHAGTGILSVSNLTFSDGYISDPTGNAFGGCIYSAGSVILNHVNVVNCRANTVSGSARGGGIFAHANLALSNSNISHNEAHAEAGFGYGGGVYVHGGLTSSYTTISDNAAGNDDAVGKGGGAYIYSTTTTTSTLLHTTVTGNTAGEEFGGIGIVAPNAAAIVVESTISGNIATTFDVGGVYIRAKDARIYNSTIAFNSAGDGTLSLSAGLRITGGAALLESTLIANNFYGDSVANDFGANVSVMGHNNLIGASDADLPSDTIVGECALLGPLRDNGGVTKTHALLSHSSAIDAGNNSFGSTFDQRGSPHSRKSGSRGTANPIADIGAYEVDQADEIFNVDFDGCP